MSDSKAVTNWEDKLAAYAKEETATVRPSSSTISLRAGVITYEGQPAPDNKLPVVVIGVAHERTYYDAPYDPDNITSPACFALAPSTEANDDLIPHENVEDPPAKACGDCPFDQWGSAGNGRRGKACSQKKRLIMIPVTALESPEAVLSAEVAMMKLPVTSVKNWDKYTQTVAATKQRPTFAVQTEISSKQDARTQFQVNFNYLEDVPLELLDAIVQKAELEKAVLLKPYDTSVEAATEAPKGKAGTKHRG